MINEQLRTELIAMRAEDKRVREELIASGEMDGSQYVPRMEELHRRNSVRLRELIAVHGWPGEDVAGKDGAEAAWFVAQHSIGEPRFQRAALGLIQLCVAERRAPAWHAAYLEDRIATHEGKPQRYGTQWMEDPADGRIRPLQLADPERVNEFRKSVGLGPLRPIPERGPELPAEQREANEQASRWWQQWFVAHGWRDL
jgi:hypothetical protein